MRQFLSVLAILASVSLTLAGCGNGGGSQPAGDTGTGTDPITQEIEREVAKKKYEKGQSPLSSDGSVGGEGASSQETTKPK